MSATLSAVGSVFNQDDVSVSGLLTTTKRLSNTPRSQLGTSMETSTSFPDASATPGTSPSETCIPCEEDIASEQKRDIGTAVSSPLSDIAEYLEKVTNGSPQEIGIQLADVVSRLRLLCDVLTGGTSMGEYDSVYGELRADSFLDGESIAASPSAMDYGVETNREERASLSTRQLKLSFDSDDSVCDNGISLVHPAPDVVVEDTLDPSRPGYISSAQLISSDGVECQQHITRGSLPHPAVPRKLILGNAEDCSL